MHEYFDFGFFKIPAWGTMVAIGVLFLVGTMFYFFKKNKVSDANVDRLILLTAFGGLIMYFSAMFFDALWHNIDVWQNTGVFKWEWWGVTFSGGLVGGLLTYFIGFWFLFKKERHNIFKYMDYIITGVAITHAFGRIGCFFAGCCHGSETTSWMGVHFPGVPGNVLPTQLFESCFLIILFLVLIFVVKRNQLRYYLVTYGVYRFGLEYLRGDSRGAKILGFMSPSQFLSVIMIIFGVFLFVFGDKLVAWMKKKFSDSNPENSNDEIESLPLGTYRFSSLICAGVSFVAVTIISIICIFPVKLALIISFLGIFIVLTLTFICLIYGIIALIKTLKAKKNGNYSKNNFIINITSVCLGGASLVASIILLCLIPGIAGAI